MLSFLIFKSFYEQTDYAFSLKIYSDVRDSFVVLSHEYRDYSVFETENCSCI